VEAVRSFHQATSFQPSIVSGISLAYSEYPVDKTKHQANRQMKQHAVAEGVVVSVAELGIRPESLQLARLVRSYQALEERCEVLRALLGVALLTVVVVDICDTETGFVTFSPLEVVEE